MAKTEFIVSCTLYCFISFTLTESCSNFMTERKRFDGFTFRLINESSLYSCAAECGSYPICKSFNFIKPGRVCQLNYKAASAADLTDDMDALYSSIGSWDSVPLSPCKTNPHRCQITERCAAFRNGNLECEPIAHNVAEGKRATSSSNFLTYSGSRPTNAVDGKDERNWISESCFAVDYDDPTPWWQVDLLKEYTVIYLVIYNRGDCCPERLHDFAIEVSSDVEMGFPEAGKQLCYMFDGVVTAAKAGITCTTPIVGRYVRVTGRKKLNRNDLLQFCEVEVYCLI